MDVNETTELPTRVTRSLRKRLASIDSDGNSNSRPGSPMMKTPKPVEPTMNHFLRSRVNSRDGSYDSPKSPISKLATVNEEIVDTPRKLNTRRSSSRPVTPAKIETSAIAAMQTPTRVTRRRSTSIAKDDDKSEAKLSKVTLRRKATCTAIAEEKDAAYVTKVLFAKSSASGNQNRNFKVDTIELIDDDNESPKDAEILQNVVNISSDDETTTVVSPTILSTSKFNSSVLDVKDEISICHSPNQNENVASTNFDNVASLELNESDALKQINMSNNGETNDNISLHVSENCNATDSKIEKNLSQSEEKEVLKHLSEIKECPTSIEKEHYDDSFMGLYINKSPQIVDSVPLEILPLEIVETGEPNTDPISCTAILSPSTEDFSESRIESNTNENEKAKENSAARFSPSAEDQSIQQYTRSPNAEITQENVNSVCGKDTTQVENVQEAENLNESLLPVSAEIDINIQDNSLEQTDIKIPENAFENASAMVLEPQEVCNQAEDGNFQTPNKNISIEAVSNNDSSLQDKSPEAIKPDKIKKSGDGNFQHLNKNFSFEAVSNNDSSLQDKSPEAIKPNKITKSVEFGLNIDYTTKTTFPKTPVSENNSKNCTNFDSSMELNDSISSFSNSKGNESFESKSKEEHQMQITEERECESSNLNVKSPVQSITRFGSPNVRCIALPGSKIDTIMNESGNSEPKDINSDALSPPFGRKKPADFELENEFNDSTEDSEHSYEELLDKEAKISLHYQSGDSIDSEERKEIEENEIHAGEETLNSSPRSEESDESYLTFIDRDDSILSLQDIQNDQYKSSRAANYSTTESSEDDSFFEVDKENAKNSDDEKYSNNKASKLRRGKRLSNFSSTEDEQEKSTGVRKKKNFSSERIAKISSSEDEKRSEHDDGENSSHSNAENSSDENLGIKETELLTDKVEHNKADNSKRNSVAAVNADSANSDCTKSNDSLPSTESNNEDDNVFNEPIKSIKSTFQGKRKRLSKGSNETSNSAPQQPFKKCKLNLSEEGAHSPTPVPSPRSTAALKSEKPTQKAIWEHTRAVLSRCDEILEIANQAKLEQKRKVLANRGNHKKPQNTVNKQPEEAATSVANLPKKNLKRLQHNRKSLLDELTPNERNLSFESKTKKMRVNSCSNVSKKRGRGESNCYDSNEIAAPQRIIKTSSGNFIENLFAEPKKLIELIKLPSGIMRVEHWSSAEEDEDDIMTPKTSRAGKYGTKNMQSVPSKQAKKYKCNPYSC